MTEADDLTLADIRRWYHEHGVPFQEQDWGPVNDVGESAGEQVQRPDRPDLNRSSAATPDRMWWWEKQQFPWRERTPEEREWLEVLDDFFAPYLGLLPRAKGNLVRQVFGELRTYAEVATEEHVARSTAHEAVQRALRDLTRIVAQDDPMFRAPQDGRRRDYDEETNAARRVFMVYLARRAKT